MHSEEYQAPYLQHVQHFATPLDNAFLGHDTVSFYRRKPWINPLEVIDLIEWIGELRRLFETHAVTNARRLAKQRQLSNSYPRTSGHLRHKDTVHFAPMSQSHFVLDLPVFNRLSKLTGALLK